jgi:hypothetical protein
VTFGARVPWKLTKAIKKPKATWVEPKFFADVEYREHHVGRLAAGQFVQRFVEALGFVVRPRRVRTRMNGLKEKPPIGG